MIDRRNMNSWCMTCNKLGVYYHKHDAWACPRCDVWLESNCNDPNCDYCKDRPKKPSQVAINNDLVSEV